MAKLKYFEKILTKLTSRNWAQLEKPLKNFPAFYGTRRFNTVFTRALHWSLSWATPIESTPYHPSSLRHILTLSTHLRHGLPSGLILYGFPTNILYAFLFSSFVLHAPPTSSSLSWSFCFARSTSYEAPHFAVFSNLPPLISLWQKYSQHLVLKHPHSMFLKH
jgi:hypothetical protein